MQSTTTSTVVGIGAAVVDYVGVVDEYPGPDTQIELQTFIKQPGGNVATALVTLARLGVSTKFLGKFGDDEFGNTVHTALKNEGVNLEASIIEPGGSMGFAFIVVEAITGKRTIMWTNEGKSHLKETELDRNSILNSQYVHLDHYSIDAAIVAAKIARSGNVQVVLDAESLHPQINQLLPMVDILIVCEDFARKYTNTGNNEQALDKLFETTAAHTVAITAGARGSYCRTLNETHRQCAFEITPLDTTGCGDVYHGAFIYGLLQHWPLSKIAEFASATASINATSLGGQSGIPGLKDVESFLRSAIALPID